MILMLLCQRDDWRGGAVPTSSSFATDLKRRARLQPRARGIKGPRQPVPSGTVRQRGRREREGTLRPSRDTAFRHLHLGRSRGPCDSNPGHQTHLGRDGARGDCNGSGDGGGSPQEVPWIAPHVEQLRVPERVARHQGRAHAQGQLNESFPGSVVGPMRSKGDRDIQKTPPLMRAVEPCSAAPEGFQGKFHKGIVPTRGTAPIYI